MEVLESKDHIEFLFVIYEITITLGTQLFIAKKLREFTYYLRLEFIPENSIQHSLSWLTVETIQIG